MFKFFPQRSSPDVILSSKCLFLVTMSSQKWTWQQLAFFHCFPAPLSTLPAFPVFIEKFTMNCVSSARFLDVIASSTYPHRLAFFAPPSPQENFVFWKCLLCIFILLFLNFYIHRTDMLVLDLTILCLNHCKTLTFPQAVLCIVTRVNFLSGTTLQWVLVVMGQKSKLVLGSSLGIISNTENDDF